jgi:hypothetical protein
VELEHSKHTDKCLNKVNGDIPGGGVPAGGGEMGQKKGQSREKGRHNRD